MKKVVLEFTNNNISYGFDHCIDWLEGQIKQDIFTYEFIGKDKTKVKTDKIINVNRDDRYFMFREEFLSPSITVKSKMYNYKFYLSGIEKIKIYTNNEKILR